MDGSGADGGQIRNPHFVRIIFMLLRSAVHVGTRCVLLTAAAAAVGVFLGAPRAIAQSSAAVAVPEQSAEARTAAQVQLSDALALVDAAERGDRTQAKRLATLVDALRGDPNLAEYDRYVLVARASALELKPAAGDQKAKLAAYADLARKLIAEFPQQTEPYASLLALAEDAADTAAAGQLAVELLESRAPDAIKAGAGRVLDREAMVKTPIEFSAKDNQGQPVSLAQFRGKVVVLYVWTGRVKAGATWVQSFVAASGDQAVYIGINFDPDQATAQLQMEQVAPGSLQVYDPSGMGGAVGTALKLTRNRSVYLIDQDGILQDVHGAEHFREKLAQLLGAHRP